MVQILGCGRTVAGDVVAYDLQWEGDLPGGSVVLAMDVTDGEQTVRLGHERRDGVFVAQYVEEPESGRRRDVDEDADLDTSGVTVRVPANLVGVAAEWPAWTGVVVVDGDEVSRKAVPLS